MVDVLMATLMIVMYKISSNGGGGGPVSFLPHQQSEHLVSSAVELHKLQGQMAST